MKLLCLGDVVGRRSVEHLEKKLWNLRNLWGVDLVVVNGENASDGNGLLPEDADRLFSAGADVITSGNHIFRRKELYPYLEEKPFLLRPANYPASCPGTGCAVTDCAGRELLVISLLGTALMEPLRSPFETADQLLEQYAHIPLKLVDFHAETTSEKKALACYLDGRVTAVVGTHTHVQTADAQVLPGGTGFITDLGMTGPVNSILGVDKVNVIRKFTTHMPVRFEKADGVIQIQGALLEVDNTTNLTRSITNVSVL